MTKKLAAIAARIAREVGDIRGHDGWEETLWDALLYSGDNLDTKQADITFGMVVTYWQQHDVGRPVPKHGRGGAGILGNVAAAMAADPPRGFKSPWHKPRGAA